VEQYTYFFENQKVISKRIIIIYETKTTTFRVKLVENMVLSRLL